jgi:transcriptional regulator with XRE-family HTH domain
MARNSGGKPETHFGRQMHKERTARGWSLREFAARTGIDITTSSMIENGKRPPNEKVALACDEAFPERRGYFLELYEEMRTWTPPGFKDWSELEDKSATLRVWMPGIVHGLVQTEDYARAVLETSPGVTDEIVATRLTARMQRQHRVLFRDDPPEAWFVVDELSLYRRVGTPEAMAVQMRHLAEVASMPNVTMQVLPAVAHPATASGFVIADDDAYAEHVAAGGVYTVSSLARVFDTLRTESYRGSESLEMFERLGETWATGESPLSALRTAATA